MRDCVSAVARVAGFWLPARASEELPALSLPLSERRGFFAPVGALAPARLDDPTPPLFVLLLLPRLLRVRRRKIGQIYLYRRNFIWGF